MYAVKENRDHHRLLASGDRPVFGNPTGVADAATADALFAASAWPLVITLIFLPLAARAYRRLRA